MRSVTDTRSRPTGAFGCPSHGAHGVARQVPNGRRPAGAVRWAPAWLRSSGAAGRVSDGRRPAGAVRRTPAQQRSRGGCGRHEPPQNPRSDLFGGRAPGRSDRRERGAAQRSESGGGRRGRGLGRSARPPPLFGGHGAKRSDRQKGKRKKTVKFSKHFNFEF